MSFTRALLASVLVFPITVTAAAQEVGPASGSLVIVGGAMRDPEILERFCNLAGGAFYLLAPGDRFDLKAREATRPGVQYRPMERVIKRPWK